MITKNFREISVNRIKLAQLVELLHIAFEIHDCILEPNINDSEAERKEIEDANRLAVIAGDFFMAAASTQLSELENQQIGPLKKKFYLC